MKNNKKTIFASALALIVCCALMLGSTFAWFTDSATNTGNVITSGKMDMGVKYRALVGETDYVDIAEDTAVFENIVWEPGRAYGYDFKIRNDGDVYGGNGVAFNYNLEIANISAPADPAAADIANVLKVYIIGADDTEITDADYVGTLAEIRDNPIVFESTKVMQKGWEDTFSLVIKMDESAGNEYQNTSVTFDLQFNAKQAEFEEDGFGNTDYDSEATY